MAKGNPKFGRRTVRKTGTKRKVGKIQATKKTVDGIDFNSMLEVFTYRKLVEAGLETNYEAKSFTILPSFTYEQVTWENRGKSVDLIIKDESNIRAITYTPDINYFDYVFSAMNDSISKGWFPPSVGENCKMCSVS